MLQTKVWRNGKFIEIDETTEFFIGTCGSGKSVFGENAKLFKINKNSLVFKTESGSLVKTEVDALNTIGKARKEDYFVSLGAKDYNDTNVIKKRVSFWNSNKGVFEYK